MTNTKIVPNDLKHIGHTMAEIPMRSMAPVRLLQNRTPSHGSIKHNTFWGKTRVENKIMRQSPRQTCDEHIFLLVTPLRYSERLVRIKIANNGNSADKLHILGLYQYYHHELFSWYHSIRLFCTVYSISQGLSVVQWMDTCLSGCVGHQSVESRMNNVIFSGISTAPTRRKHFGKSKRLENIIHKHSMYAKVSNLTG